MMTFEEFMNSDLVYGKDTDFIMDYYFDYVDSFEEDENLFEKMFDKIIKM